MKIVSVVFDYGSSDSYRRMFDVFRKSCAAVMPGVYFEAIQVRPPAEMRAGYSTGMNSNVHKLRIWAEVMEQAKETVVFADCDMLALASCEDVEQMDFDIAYTVRKHGSAPVNGGIVFVRPTERGRAALRLWNEIDERMYRDKPLHLAYRKKYAGMNQAAFGYLIEHHADVAKMLPLPCSRYNSCTDTWPEIGPQTRFVHIKGVLRRGLMSRMSESYFAIYLRPVVRIWKSYEASAEIPVPANGAEPPRPIVTLAQAARIGERRERNMAYSITQLRRRRRV